MPIYEYRCTKCGNSLEALQKLSDAPLVKCPVCAKRALVKLVSAASFRLKGGGWYETDFKTGDKKQLADSDSASDAKGASDSDTGSDKSSDKKAEKVASDTAKPSSTATPAKDTKQDAKPAKGATGTKSGKPAKGKTTSSSRARG